MLYVKFASGFTPSAGQSFDLITGATTGNFSQVNLPPLANGMSWNTGSLYATGTISVVPEPSTLALLGFGRRPSLRRFSAAKGGKNCPR